MAGCSPRSQDTDGFLEGLAESLRAASRRAGGLSAAEQRRVLSYCLAYRLRGVEPSTVPDLLDRLRNLFEDGRTAGARPLGWVGPGTGEWDGAERVLRDLLARYGGPDGSPPGDSGEIVAEAGRIVEEISGRIEAMTGGGRVGNKPLGVCLDLVDRKLLAAEGAATRSAQEFFDRILEAFDPEGAKAYVGKQGMKPMALYKGSLYDALCEKFSQLSEYHGRGRLVRDFRASFLKNMQADPADEVKK